MLVLLLVATAVGVAIYVLAREKVSLGELETPGDPEAHHDPTHLGYRSEDPWD